MILLNTILQSLGGAAFVLVVMELTCPELRDPDESFWKALKNDFTKLGGLKVFFALFLVFIAFQGFINFSK